MTLRELLEKRVSVRPPRAEPVPSRTGRLPPLNMADIRLPTVLQTQDHGRTLIEEILRLID